MRPAHVLTIGTLLLLVTPAIDRAAAQGRPAPVTDRVTVAVNMRAGWELHLRLNGSVGLLLGP